MTLGPVNLRKILLLVAVGLALYKFSESFEGFSFSPRDEIAATKAAEIVAAQQEAAAIAAAPALMLDPASFSTLTYTGLSRQLRSDGFNVRCYGNLERKEKLYPTITQICWTKARKAWNIPLEGISFHFAGETLQLVRIEFPNAQWTEAKAWFDTLPGQMAGTFGTDGKGHEVLGKSFATGFLMTAKPPNKATVMMLWESRELLADRCSGKDRSFSPWQRKIVCEPG
jgi:hypothetical protein